MQPSSQTALEDLQSSQQQPVFPRELILQIVQAALEVREYRFAQEVTLGWLAAFPGDLQVSLMYAQALTGSQRVKQAVRVLEGLCQVDPEFNHAVEALQVARKIYPEENPSNTNKNTAPLLTTSETASITDQSLLDWSIALSGNRAKRSTPQDGSWGVQLFQVRKQVSQGECAQAQVDLLPILALDPNNPLPGVTHLQLMAQSGMAPPLALRSLAEHYLRRWPDCLVFKLYLAEALMDIGETARGVSLLHEAARRDVGGQVANRLWGLGHRYTSLWPAPLELAFHWIVPAGVAAKIGWNKLPPGELVFVTEEPPPLVETKRVRAAQAVRTMSSAAIAAAMTESPSPAAASITATAVPTAKSLDIEILPVQGELYRIADHIHRPEIKSLDARYPVYVILAVHSTLVAKYGEQAAEQILSAASSLAIKVQSHAAKHADFRWGARLFLADRPESSGIQGLKPAHPGDATSLKAGLVALDDYLAHHGERIGALLILGGAEIVPFHMLPNPVDDQDSQVPSDNPYACRGQNHFLPEWPVGRLPDGAGHDPSLLMTQLERMGKHYNHPNAPRGGYRTWLNRLTDLIRRSPVGSLASIGYSAAVWKQASESVFKPIGKFSRLHTSPPYGIPESGSSQKAGRGVPNLSSRFAYFNLHGLVDAGEWFGQRELLAGGNEPDYPVALRPQDVQSMIRADGRSKNAQIPEVIFSEACYGANIIDKTISDAISLAFLEAGTRAVVGSTAMSYGSINAPLIAADFLGFHFWTLVRQGVPVGEALRQARLRLAQEMNVRQGFLDGEDQKTLISFVLYGDPLLQIIPNPTGRKSITRSLEPPVEISMVCDRACQFSADVALSESAWSSVRDVVAKYMPGMQGANITVSKERAVCSGVGRECPHHPAPCKSAPVNMPERRLVTLSKSFHPAERNLTLVARLTLDCDGKVVKLVISR